VSVSEPSTVLANSHSLEDTVKPSVTARDFNLEPH